MVSIGVTFSFSSTFSSDCSVLRVFSCSRSEIDSWNEYHHVALKFVKKKEDFEKELSHASDDLIPSRHEQQQQREDRGYSNFLNRCEASDYVSASPAYRVNMKSIFSPAKVLSGGGSDRVKVSS